MARDAVRILAIDAGTTGVTALVFDGSRAVVGRGYAEFPQHYPRPGWVEHDPEEVWGATRAAWSAALAAARTDPAAVTCIGVTNQRETTALWRRSDGKPVHRAIVWQDRRTAERCRALRRMEKKVVAKTGLRVDPYFCATKLEWLLAHVPGAAADAAAGRLAFGTIDSWLLWRLTAGAVHATDVTNASRTLLWEIHAGRWDPGLLATFAVPVEVLPAVHASGHAYGATDVGVFGAAVPITGVAGDQQAALFGQGCTEPGQTKCTYGTGCFLLQHTGATAKRSRHGLLTTRAASLDDRPLYALEGSVFVGGAAVQWFRDGLGLIRRAADIDALAGSVGDSDGVVVVPAFSGLGAPHWDADARGAILGLTRGATKAHLARATLEGIAHQVCDVVDAMSKDSGATPGVLRVDGGATRSDPLMQMQADLLRCRVERPADVEATARGAALLAGITAGVWTTADVDPGHPEAAWKPRASRRETKAARKRWASAVRTVRAFRA